VLLDAVYMIHCAADMAMASIRIEVSILQSSEEGQVVRSHRTKARPPFRTVVVPTGGVEFLRGTLHQCKRCRKTISTSQASGVAVNWRRCLLKLLSSHFVRWLGWPLQATMYPRRERLHAPAKVSLPESTRRYALQLFGRRVLTHVQSLSPNALTQQFVNPVCRMLGDARMDIA
jgi:hypothetical protein